MQRFKGHFCAFLTLVLLSGGAFAACPEKDLSLEDESLGVIYADDLEAGEEQTVFSGACFSLGGLDLTTPKITITGETFTSDVLTVAGDGVSGTVQQLSGNAEQRVLKGVRLVLTLPSQVLSGVPLEAGTYLLEGNATQQGEAWTFQEALLTRQDGRTERYSLQDAVLQDGKLKAREALLVQDLNQLRAEEVMGTPEQLTAEQIEFCVCRELEARELLVRGQDLEVNRTSFSVQSVRFYAYGLETPNLGTLVLPLDPENPLLTAVQDAFLEYRSRLDQKPVEVVSASSGVALRNLPVSLDLYSRLNLGVHNLPQGTAGEVLLDRETPEFRVQVGLPGVKNQTAQGFTVLLDATPTGAPALRAHFRTGAQETSELGVGYRLNLGDASLLGLVSFAQENQQTALVYALEGKYAGSVQLDAVNLQADTLMRLQYTRGDVAVIHDGWYQIGYQNGPWALSLRHDLGTQFGNVHFSAFVPEQQNETKFTASYSPENWHVKYSLTQDWLRSQTLQQGMLSGPVLEVAGQTRYDAKAERWLNLSVSTTFLLKVSEGFRAEPMLGYDFATGQVLYGFGGTFYTPNYLYTLGAYHQASGWGLKARIGLR